MRSVCGPRTGFEDVIHVVSDCQLLRDCDMTACRYVSVRGISDLDWFSVE